MEEIAESPGTVQPLDFRMAHFNRHGPPGVHVWGDSSSGAR